MFQKHCRRRWHTIPSAPSPGASGLQGIVLDNALNTEAESQRPGSVTLWEPTPSALGSSLFLVRAKLLVFIAPGSVHSSNFLYILWPGVPTTRIQVWVSLSSFPVSLWESPVPDSHASIISEIFFEFRKNHRSNAWSSQVPCTQLHLGLVSCEHSHNGGSRKERLCSLLTNWETFQILLYHECPFSGAGSNLGAHIAFDFQF